MIKAASILSIEKFLIIGKLSESITWKEKAYIFTDNSIEDIGKCWTTWMNLNLGTASSDVHVHTTSAKRKKGAKTPIESRTTKVDNPVTHPLIEAFTNRMWADIQLKTSEPIHGCCFAGSNSTPPETYPVPIYTPPLTDTITTTTMTDTLTDTFPSKYISSCCQKLADFPRER